MKKFNKFWIGMVAVIGLFAVTAATQRFVSSVLIDQYDDGTKIKLEIRNAVNQSTNIIQAVNGSGTVIFAVSSNGVIAQVSGGTGGTNASTAKTALGFQSGDWGGLGFTNSATITFGTAYSAAPRISLTLTNNGNAPYATSVTTTNFVVNVATGTNVGGIYFAHGAP